MKKTIILMLVIVFASVCFGQSRHPAYKGEIKSTTTWETEFNVYGDFIVQFGTSTDTMNESMIILSTGTIWLDQQRTYGIRADTITANELQFTSDSGASWDELGASTTYFPDISLFNIRGGPVVLENFTVGALTGEGSSVYMVHKSFTREVYFQHNPAGHYIIYSTSNTFRLSANSDVDDFVYVYVDGNIPEFLWGGASAIGGFRYNDTTDRMQFTNDRTSAWYDMIGSTVSGGGGGGTVDPVAREYTKSILWEGYSRSGERDIGWVDFGAGEITISSFTVTTGTTSASVDTIYTLEISTYRISGVEQWFVAQGTATISAGNFYISTNTWTSSFTGTSQAGTTGRVGCRTNATYSGNPAKFSIHYIKND